MFYVIFSMRIPFASAQHIPVRFAVKGREFARGSIPIKPVSTD